MVPAVEAGEFVAPFTLTERADSLSGVVRDGRGGPVGNAKLHLGESFGTWPYGDAPRSGPGRSATSDSQGAFRFVGVATDPDTAVLLRVCAPGRALLHLPVVVDGPAVVAVNLSAEARLTGTARDPDGEPAWRGQVEVALPELLDKRRALPRWATLSAEPGRDGRYLIGNVPAGRHGVRAADGVDIANAELEFQVGEERIWDARMRERVIFGEVADDRGRPLASVNVAVANTMVPAVTPTRTDREGRFRLDGLDDVPYELIVGNDYYDGVLRIPGVAPSATPQRVTLPASFLPTANISLRIDIPRRGCSADVTLRRLRRGGPWDSIITRCDGGHFTSPRLRAGNYHVRVTVPGFGVREVGLFDLAVDQQLELPPVRFLPSGELAIELVGEAAEQRAVWITPAHGSRFDGTLALVPERQVTVRELQPGSYWLVVMGSELSVANAEVVSGATTTVRLTISNAPSRRVCCPAESEHIDTWTWFDAQQQFVGYINRSNLASEVVEIPVQAGTFSVEARAGRDVVARALIEVTDDTRQIVLPSAPWRGAPGK